jgi:FAD/FMN-containing dehydrogenase
MMDNILEYEVVLSNVSIINVTPTSSPDLFLVLKGGGNSFGIVTSYVVKAHPQPAEVWGGIHIIERGEDTDAVMLKAFRDFAEYNMDEKASILLTAERALDTSLDTFHVVNKTSVDWWIAFLYYDGPEPPANIFHNFTSITPLLSTLGKQKASTLVKFNNWGALHGMIYTIAGETTPLPNEQEAGILEAYHQYWRNVSESVLPKEGLIASIAYTPLDKNVVRRSQSQGGNLLGLDTDVTRIFHEFDYSFNPMADVPAVDAVMQKTYGGIRERALGFMKERILPDAYMLIYLNNGYFRQDYFARLSPQMRELARKVQKEVDSTGMWHSRTGGFKIT